MQVRKRNGDVEPVDVNKIVRAVERVCDDLADVDPLRVATKTISGLYDGATTAELDRLSIQTAAEMIGEEPQYSRLAARLLAGYIDKEVRGQGVTSFSQSIALGHAEGLIGDETAASSRTTPASSTTPSTRTPTGGSSTSGCARSTTATCCGTRSRLVVETPQYWLLRVACGLASTPAEAIEFYRLMSSLAYLPSSPTLFNSGTRHTQMSSCFLVDSPRDDLDSIYERYQQVARLSKFAGGIGIAWSRVRSRGALIRGTNGAVQRHRAVPAHPRRVGGRGQPGRPAQGRGLRLPRAVAPGRRGVPRAAGQHRRGRPAHAQPQPGQLDPGRVHAPGRGRRGVVADRPDQAPELPDLWGEAFDAAYRRAEEEGRYVRQVKARDLYGQMMRTLAQTGNGWMTFKDAANRTCNQTGDPSPGNAVSPVQPVHRDHRGHLRRRDRGLQPRLDQPRPAPHRPRTAIDWDKLRATVRTAVPLLDRVIDINYYPSAEAAASNPRGARSGSG